MYEPPLANYWDYLKWLYAIRRERAKDAREWKLYKLRPAKIWAYKFMLKHANETLEEYSEWLNK